LVKLSRANFGKTISFSRIRRQYFDKAFHMSFVLYGHNSRGYVYSFDKIKDGLSELKTNLSALSNSIITSFSTNTKFVTELNSQTLSGFSDVRNYIDSKIANVHSFANRELTTVKQDLNNLKSQTLSGFSDVRNYIDSKIANVHSFANRELTTVKQDVNAVKNWFGAQFCIFANGNCPSGFYRREGYLKAIRQNSAGSSYIKEVDFGSSSIKCHGEYCGRWNPDHGQLNLAVCCK